MQVSTKGRYAVMAMADLAVAGEGAVVSLAEISGRQQISLAYLEQLFAKLRRAGLVESVRGPGGGYRLASDAGSITLNAVMAAVDEPVKMTRCTSEMKGGCVAENRCLTHDLWRSLGDHIVSFLSAVTLADVAGNA
ncbi:MAG: Rrf2 family transcriptional regulator, partial [Alphaproteobacteria bacterium]